MNYGVLTSTSLVSLLFMQYKLIMNDLKFHFGLGGYNVENIRIENSCVTMSDVINKGRAPLARSNKERFVTR